MSMDNKQANPLDDDYASASTGPDADGESATPITVANLLPNTGYQFVFLPLFAEDPAHRAAIEAMDGVPRLSTRARIELNNAVVQEGWRTSAEHPWMRARVEIRRGKYRNPATKLSERIVITGILVAIETNIGSVDRGYLLRESRMNVALKDKPEAQERAKSPFYAEREGEIPTGVQYLDIHRIFGFDQVDGWSGSAVLGLNWQEPNGDPIRVDLVVDFGNSRTNVLGLEYAASHSQSLQEICRPIGFSAHMGVKGLISLDLDDLDVVLPESWFVLQQPTFQQSSGMPENLISTYQIETRKQGLLGGAQQFIAGERRLVPDVFRQVSPALMGELAKAALVEETEDGGKELDRLSSPKRYIWDRDLTGGDHAPQWSMRRQIWESHRTGAASTKLQGEILAFMDRQLTPFDPKEPPTRWGPARAPDPQGEPNHPLAAGMVFAALMIIETAFRQINSPEWRERSSQPRRRRMIDTVVLTSPPGWTGTEAQSLYELWLLAARIFFASRSFAEGEKGPDIDLTLDEALAAQLPFVFSEISQFGNDGERFIELFGRKGPDGRAGVRVMTIDIGGGTTDTCIVEYRDEGLGGQTQLIFDPIFRDSSTSAGDHLMQKLVEGVLLPSLFKYVGPDIQKRGREFFGSKRLAPGLRKDLVTRFVFIPVVRRLLNDIQIDRDPETKPSWLVEGVNPDHLASLEAALKEAGLAELVPDDWYQPIDVSYGDVRKTVREWLEPMAQEHAQLAAAFCADIIVLTGKPSELPLVRDVFKEYLPLHPDRIISAKGYYAGNWAPLTSDGTIRDAKLVTALGAALHRAIVGGHIANWSIRKAERHREPQRHAWGTRGPERFTERDVFMQPEDDTGTDEMAADSFISRALFLNHSRPEQVYQLRWIGPREERPRSNVRVTFERMQPRPQPDRALEIAEKLRLVKAEIRNADNEWVETNNLELRLCTLPAGERYWLDTGDFHVA